MKTILLCSVLLLPLTGHGQDQNSQEGQRECLIKGSVFQQAAGYRDINISPQDAFKILKGERLSGIDEAFLKKAINHVYFDPNFTYAGGQALMTQVADMCMHPNGKYKPLE